MARSSRKLLLLLTAALASGAAAAPPPALQPGEQPITLDAASSEVDYRTNTVVFSEVVISQGATRVQADHAHATGLNFANSRWTFEGKVRIDAEQHGNLRSDQATVDFRNNRIARATITGKPAEFEQKRADSEQMARGHADEIVYDLSDGTVQLSNEAWLTDGQNEISGPLLVYNVRAQRVQAAAAPGTDQRVHITITPHGVPGPGKTEPAKPSPPDAGKGDAAKPQPTAQP
ncbi:MAG TPA: lipopolysaccharide transport periplasmic protein LptA [Steroidobacteraceae bacterium]|nr:lipopolysaccharide transport periplasmic protein LptA [Steroidobacteraceae bacterium]